MRNEAKVTMMIPVELLDPHPQNPRKNLGDLTELTASIRANGILQNLTVMDEGERFRVLIGHRRLAAAKEAGVKMVPCYIMEPAPDEKTQVLIMLQENMQRSDLTLIEEADGFQMALDLGCTVNDLAEKTGLSGQTIRNRMTISQLDRSILESMSYQLTIMDYIELAKIEDVKKRNDLLKKSKTHDVLKYAIERAIYDQKYDKQKAAAIKFVQDAGFKHVIEQDSYFNVLHTVFFELKHEIPDEIKARAKDKNVFYRVNWNSIEIIELSQKEKEKPSLESDKWQQMRENREKTVAEIKDFLRMAIYGKIDVKDSGDSFKELIDLAILNPDDGPDSYSQVYRKFIGYHPTEEDLKDFEQRFRKISATLWMLTSCAPDTWDPPADIRSFVDILGKYGFTLSPELSIWIRSADA